MLTTEILIAPLRMFLLALGTGVMPGTDPVSALRVLIPDLEALRARASTADVNVAPLWRGDGREAALALARRTATESVGLVDDGREIEAVTLAAARRVARAAAALSALVDSFERAVRTLGPSLWSPAALATVIPVAIDHIGRGAEIVGRTRSDLAADSARLAQIVRHETPAPRRVAPVSTAPLPLTPRPAASTAPTGADVTLPDGTVVHAPTARAATAVRAALSQRGVRYMWGGTTPAGFDCSGLTQWAYRQAGIELPRLAQDQDTAGTPVAQHDVLPGDLAVWDGHVAMVIGNNQMIEAGDPVAISTLRTTNAGQGFQGFYRPR